MQAGGRRFDPDCLHHPLLPASCLPARCSGQPIRRWRALAALASAGKRRHGSVRLGVNAIREQGQPWMGTVYRGMSEFGVIMCLGIASWMWDRAVYGRCCGRVVLWKCESGSGASLGACDQLVRMDWWRSRCPIGCLTGKGCPLACMIGKGVRDKRPNGWTARVQRRCERFVGWIPAVCASNELAVCPEGSCCVRKTQYFQDRLWAGLNPA